MRLVLALIAAVASCASPAYAYDPDASRGSGVGPKTSGAPVQLPPGLYHVSEVYAGDVTTRAGLVTTYTTRTEHRVTDTYARVLESLATGEASRFDGAAFNGRGALSNGTALAGTYYQNFVRDGDGFVPVSIVFFQDDSERARREAALRSPAPSASSTPTASRSLAASPAPTRSPTRSVWRPSAPPLVTSVVIGLDPIGGPAVLDRLAVLRGARYAFAVNVRGAPVAVTLEAWQLVDGTNDATNPTGWRSPLERLAGRWSVLPAPDGAWSLTLRVRVRPASGGQAFEAVGRVAIVVRSPAVID